jgi:cyclophilin family peptidyl-prolyl cis-trans isomerase
VLSSAAFTPAERAEAARALPGIRRGSQALLGILPSIAPREPHGLLSDAFGIALTALQALPGDLPDGPDKELWAIARLEMPAGAGSAAVRRASALRCAAAVRLARAAWESDVLSGCDLAEGEAGENARLAALDRGPLSRAKRAAWSELLHSKHVRVREAALEVIGRHGELGEVALLALAEALSSELPGVVASAAKVINEHPDRVYLPTEADPRAAAHPGSLPDGSVPSRQIDRRIAVALGAALARPWSEDLVETRTALLDASLAAGLEEGKLLARAACKDANLTVRTHAAKALAGWGERGARCPAPDRAGSPAAEIGHELERPSRVTFETDAGVLAVTFDPIPAPIAATRLVSLARSGFFAGVPFHRVVPGFVVQFGDRGGDGYGGAGTLLRCETSPMPFAPLDVGVALAGRDTGSSQIFVTLARHPHLDGQYAWVGRAEGDWNGIAEGDVIRSVHVDE